MMDRKDFVLTRVMAHIYDCLILVPFKFKSLVSAISIKGMACVLYLLIF